MLSMIRNELPINGELMPAVRVGRDWFRFFANLFTAVTRGSVDPIEDLTVTASPLVYQATTRGQVIVSGGTVTSISLSRDGTSYYDTGLTAGVFPVSAADRIKVVYAVAPTVFSMIPL